MKCDIPLIGESIKLHFVTFAPLVHGTTNLDFAVSWTSVVEHENLWLLAVLYPVKGAHNMFDFHHPIW